jgi:hypothetical protein
MQESFPEADRFSASLIKAYAGKGRNQCANVTDFVGETSDRPLDSRLMCAIWGRFGRAEGNI